MSRPGKTEGYVLVDALVAVLIAALVASVLLAGLGTASRIALKSLDRAVSTVEERNAAVSAELGLEGP